MIKKAKETENFREFSNLLKNKYDKVEYDMLYCFDDNFDEEKCTCTDDGELCKYCESRIIEQTEYITITNKNQIDVAKYLINKKIGFSFTRNDEIIIKKTENYLD